MKEIQGNSILGRVSVRFQLARVRVVGSRKYTSYISLLPCRVLKKDEDHFCVFVLGRCPLKCGHSNRDTCKRNNTFVKLRADSWLDNLLQSVPLWVFALWKRNLTFKLRPRRRSFPTPLNFAFWRCAPVTDRSRSTSWCVFHHVFFRVKELRVTVLRCLWPYLGNCLHQNCSKLFRPAYQKEKLRGPFRIIHFLLASKHAQKEAKNTLSMKCECALITSTWNINLIFELWEEGGLGRFLEILLNFSIWGQESWARDGLKSYMKCVGFRCKASKR